MHWKIFALMTAIWIAFLVSFILAATSENDNDSGKITAASLIFVASSVAFVWIGYKMSNMEPTMKKWMGRATPRGLDTGRELLDNDTDDESNVIWEED